MAAPKAVPIVLDEQARGRLRGPIDWRHDVQAHGPQPETLLHCAAWYAGTGSSRDASAETQTLGLIPTRRLAELLGLSRDVDSAWHDRAGLAVQDASVTVGGPPVLAMRRDLASKWPTPG